MLCTVKDNRHEIQLFLQQEEETTAVVLLDYNVCNFQNQYSSIIKIQFLKK